nr:hypothetical protein [Vibrio fluvialis]
MKRDTCRLRERFAERRFSATGLSKNGNFIHVISCGVVNSHEVVTQNPPLRVGSTNQKHSTTPPFLRNDDNSCVEVFLIHFHTINFIHVLRLVNAEVLVGYDPRGVGSAVAELVRKFYPSLIELDYSPEVKRMMVYKAREIINDGRLQFDGEWDDLVHSFLMIRQQTTKASNQVTFISNRSKVGSHADLAWASMHVMHWEPIDIHSEDDTTVSFF